MNEARPVAIVTGASSGIGRAAARALADRGFVVVGTSRRGSGEPDTDGMLLLPLDVTSDTSATALVQDVLDRFGRIDVLVNNAGIGLLGAAEESSAEQAARVLDVNVLGAIRMTNAVLPHMRGRGSGRVVNVSSVLGLMPAPFMAVYSATKHALEGYSESLDHEIRALGVRVLLVEPAYTSTSFEGSALAPDRPLTEYDAQRATAADVLAAAMRGADDPAVVADIVAKAATDRRPRVRYPAGPLARRVSLLRRLAPRAAFDRQVRSLNRLP
ncbi:oxidoreductase [Aeromicrobium sp. Leaf289]|uniref:oxidoreductase n=1 Tax=Aeromicrobium sp. Leaf289 TaxID=1736324 RepID=UPI0007020DE3|nr:oxidoreductase [Aeromicrobium sp. Leaf289]KQP78703.1 oxidoreductase [Aeromicrobium sp. Leaf289]